MERKKGEEDKLMRVNKVTVYVGTEVGERSVITLYRTNSKLAEITNNKLDIPDFIDADVDKNTYQAYCKEVVINLLENGGIEGYHWEPKQTESDTTTVRKFDSSTFRTEAISRVVEILDSLTADTDITHDVIKFRDDGVDITDRYKDKNIKFGSTNVTVNIKRYDTTIQATIAVEIRSGQMCKPKIFTIDGIQHQLNITTLTRMFK